MKPMKNLIAITLLIFVSVNLMAQSGMPPSDLQAPSEGTIDKTLTSDPVKTTSPRELKKKRAKRKILKEEKMQPHGEDESNQGKPIEKKPVMRTDVETD
jgi:hypothetical protein